jgi:hypothetical protein
MWMNLSQHYFYIKFLPITKIFVPLHAFLLEQRIKTVVMRIKTGANIL